MVKRRRGVEAALRHLDPLPVLQLGVQLEPAVLLLLLVVHLSFVSRPQVGHSHTRSEELGDDMPAQRRRVLEGVEPRRVGHMHPREAVFPTHTLDEDMACHI
jgi:hypothetical protein